MALKFHNTWKVDAHIFIETASPQNAYSAKLNVPGVIYHFNELLPKLGTQLPKNDRYPNAVWGRLLLAGALSEYDKIFYVDVDILPGPKPLDIENIELPNGIGLVSNYWTRLHERLGHRRTMDHMSMLGITADEYFNTGSILFDPKLIQIDEVTEALKEFLAQFAGKIKSPDQDFLAYHYRDRVTQLSANLNFIDPLMGFGFEGDAIPAIRHYVSKPKPYEKLYAFGHTKKLWAAQQEFQDLLRQANLPAELLTPPRKPKLSKRLKTCVRMLTANSPLGKHRKVREQAKWHQTRAILLELLLADQPNCADTQTISWVGDCPQTHWTGITFEQAHK